MITESLVSLWLMYIRGVSKYEAQLAAEFLLTQKTYGEPKLNDFLHCLERLRDYVRPGPPQTNTQTVTIGYNAYCPQADPVPVDYEVDHFLRNKPSPREMLQAQRQIMSDINRAIGRDVVKELR